MRNPELSLLSALTHGGKADDALEIAVAALNAVRRLDLEHQRIYSDLVLAALPSALSAAVENLMKTAGYEYRSDFARKYYGQGKAEGKAEGIAEGMRKAVVALLAARGIAVTEAERAQIDECGDATKLEAMVRRAATAASAAEVLRDA